MLTSTKLTLSDRFGEDKIVVRGPSKVEVGELWHENDPDCPDPLVAEEDTIIEISIPEVHTECCGGSAAIICPDELLELYRYIQNRLIDLGKL